MKKNIYQLLLTVTFLLRIMVPIGNAAYLMCMVSTGKNTGWTAVFVVAILLEVAVMLAAGAGLQSPEARRWGAYGTFALVIIHFMAFMLLYVFHPACRQVLTPLYMVLFTAVSILLLCLANGSLLSASEMPDPMQNIAVQDESSEIV